MKKGKGHMSLGWTDNVHWHLLNNGRWIPVKVKGRDLCTEHLWYCYATRYNLTRGGGMAFYIMCPILRKQWLPHLLLKFYLTRKFGEKTVTFGCVGMHQAIHAINHNNIFQQILTCTSNSTKPTIKGQIFELILILKIIIKINPHQK